MKYKKCPDVLGHNGDCCCVCVHQTIVGKHPCNKIIGKGPFTEAMGYVCTVGEKIDGSGFTFHEDRHGCCENFWHKDRK